MLFPIVYWYYQPVNIDSFSREQVLSNLIADKKFVRAMGLAISLNKPYKALNIMKGWLNLLHYWSVHFVLFLGKRDFHLMVALNFIKNDLQFSIKSKFHPFYVFEGRGLYLVHSLHFSCSSHMWPSPKDL